MRAEAFAEDRSRSEQPFQSSEAASTGQRACQGRSTALCGERRRQSRSAWAPCWKRFLASRPTRPCDVHHGSGVRSASRGQSRFQAIAHSSKPEWAARGGDKRLICGGGGRNRTGVDGFAGRCMTTLPPRLVGCGRAQARTGQTKRESSGSPSMNLERETSLELATSTLARLRSTN